MRVSFVVQRYPPKRMVRRWPVAPAFKYSVQSSWSLSERRLSAAMEGGCLRNQHVYDVSTLWQCEQYSQLEWRRSARLLWSLPLFSKPKPFWRMFVHFYVCWFVLFLTAPCTAPELPAVIRIGAKFLKPGIGKVFHTTSGKAMCWSGYRHAEPGSRTYKEVRCVDGQWNVDTTCVSSELQFVGSIVLFLIAAHKCTHPICVSCRPTTACRWYSVSLFWTACHRVSWTLWFCCISLQWDCAFSEPCNFTATSDMSILSGDVELRNSVYHVEGGVTVRAECRGTGRRISATCDGAVFKPKLSCTEHQDEQEGKSQLQGR